MERLALIRHVAAERTAPSCRQPAVVGLQVSPVDAAAAHQLLAHSAIQPALCRTRSTSQLWLLSHRNEVPHIVVCACAWPDDWLSSSLLNNAASVSSVASLLLFLIMCVVPCRTGLGDETPVLPETHLGDITMAGVNVHGIHHGCGSI